MWRNTTAPAVADAQRQLGRLLAGAAAAPPSQGGEVRGPAAQSSSPRPALAEEEAGRGSPWRRWTCWVEPGRG